MANILSFPNGAIVKCFSAVERLPSVLGKISWSQSATESEFLQNGLISLWCASPKVDTVIPVFQSVEFKLELKTPLAQARPDAHSPTMA